MNENGIRWFEPTDKHRQNLGDKLIDFRLTSPRRTVAGIGKIIVRGDCVHMMAVDIEVPDANGCELFHLSTDLVEKIDIHPDPTKAVFRLSA